jgi:hypothetical protein
MATCKVIFQGEDDQKIILDFTADDSGLEYKPTFEPPIDDPKKDLGLAGALCQFMVERLSEIGDKPEITTIPKEDKPS